MLSMKLTGPRAMELCRAPTPAIKSAGDVLLKTAVVGVCGSDIHYYLRGRIGSQQVSYPFTVGHECSAVVAEVGDPDCRVRPGDLVAVEPAMYCMKCAQCRIGRHNTCLDLRFLGCPGQAEGCLSEFLVMPSECCLPVPPNLSPEQAALVEPLAIGLYAARLSALPPGAAVGVLGCGPIGLSVLLCAALGGARAIYATDKVQARLAAAESAGAAWTGNPEKEDVVGAVASREPTLLDVVFECCGSQDALDQAVEMVKPGGKLMFIGIPAEPRISFSAERIRRKEICVQNVRRQLGCAVPVMELMASGKLDAGFMITHRFPFEKTREAFDLTAGYADGVIKAMVML